MLRVPSVATIAGTLKMVTMNPLIIPEDEPESEPHQRSPPAASSACELEGPRDRIGDQPDRRLDREVDVPGDDDEGFADGGDRR